MINYPFLVFVSVYAASFAYVIGRCHDRLPLRRYLSNHVLLLAPLNFLFMFFRRGDKTVVLPTASVPGLDKIKENYEAIRAEARMLLESGVLERPPVTDEPGYNSFERGGWRLYSIKRYEASCKPEARHTCPRTCAVLDSIPAVRAAMFTLLPPGGRLGRHHDPVASTLRYHLGLVTPNSSQCALTLDGRVFPWSDGEDLLFDQTYLHSARNDTESPRIILFCDVENPLLARPIRALADVVNDLIVARLTGGDGTSRRSWISTAYVPIYRVRRYVKSQIKPRSLIAYNVIKFGAIGLGILLIFGLLNLLL